MTTSEPKKITLSEAFDSVELTEGAAQSLLQWMGQQVGHDTEAGLALNAGGQSIGQTPPPSSKPTTPSATSTGTKSV